LPLSLTVLESLDAGVLRCVVCPYPAKRFTSHRASQKHPAKIASRTRTLRARRIAKPRIRPITMPARIARMPIVARYSSQDILLILVLCFPTCWEPLSDFPEHIFQKEKGAEGEERHDDVEDAD